MAGKLPWMQFYPGDWMKEPTLRRCSHAVKGVFVDMLCLMWECEPRGILATGGIAWTDHEIARAIGGEFEIVFPAVSELVSKGVVSRDESGAVMSRRMVSDDNKRHSANLRLKKHRRKMKRARNANETPLETQTSVSVSVSPSLCNKDVKPRRKTAAFVKPTIDEIRALCEAENLDVDPSEFFNHYESNGWRVGKNPMKNWQATLRNWHSRAGDFSGSKRQNADGLDAYRSVARKAGLFGDSNAA